MERSTFRNFVSTRILIRCIGGKIFGNIRVRDMQRHPQRSIEVICTYSRSFSMYNVKWRWSLFKLTNLELLESVLCPLALLEYNSPWNCNSKCLSTLQSVKRNRSSRSIAFNTPQSYNKPSSYVIYRTQRSEVIETGFIKFWRKILQWRTNIRHSQVLNFKIYVSLYSIKRCISINKQTYFINSY